jgi:hypothetical protein
MPPGERKDMVIFVKPDGTTVIENDVLGLGSYVGKIAIVSPTRTGAFVTLKVMPPSGRYMEPLYAAPMLSTDAEQLGIYLCDVAEGITSVSGRVRYQVSFEYEDGSEELTPEGTFAVTPGVISIPPEEPTRSMYEEIRSAMIASAANYAELIQKLDDVWEKAKIIEESVEAVNKAKDEVIGAAEKALENTRDALEQAKESGEFDGVSVTHRWDGTELIVTSASGTSKSDLRGPEGKQGKPGERGETGKGFEISKTYASISAMNAGFASDGVPLYGFVLIDTGNVEDADNAKLYVKQEGGYHYLTDLSGSQGIKGERGLPGVYIGNNTPPDDARVWVNPDGDPTDTENWDFDMADGTTETKKVVVVDSDEATANGRLGILRVRDENGAWQDVPALVGRPGNPGANGKDGKDGVTPQKGVDYFDGKDGVDGRDNVYVGSVPPVDDDVIVWVDPDGEPTSVEDLIFHHEDGTSETKTFVVVDPDNAEEGEKAAILRVRKPDGTWADIPAIIGARGADGKDGKSGVHIGTSQPTDDSNVWINPDGEPTTVEDWDFDLDDGTTDTKQVVVIGSDEAAESGKAAIMKLKDSSGNWVEIPALVGPRGKQGEPGKQGKDGVSGVYVGTSTPPDNANVWINPNGEPTGTEPWEFDLDDGTTEEKDVVVLGATEASGKLGILKFKQPDGTWLEIPAIRGTDGKDGTPVTVANVTESAEDGGSNVVTFSDGKSVTVRNGKTGGKGDPGYTPQKNVDYVDGKDGTSVTIQSISESTESGGSNVVIFSGGKSVTVKNGKDGKDGKDGTNYVITEADKSAIAASIMASLKTEVLNITYEDGSTGTMEVYVK